jgi:tetratricopeptide (TPR) repeat protein
MLERVRTRRGQRYGTFDLLAVADARRGDSSSAWDHLASEHVSLARHLESMSDVVYTLGQWEKAGEVLEQIRALTHNSGLVALPAFANRLEGGMAWAEGDVTRAHAALNRARETFARIEARWETARTDLAIAEVQHATRSPEMARRHLMDALRVFEPLHSVRELQRTRELLEG